MRSRLGGALFGAAALFWFGAAGCSAGGGASEGEGSGGSSGAIAGNGGAGASGGAGGSLVIDSGAGNGGAGGNSGCTEVVDVVFVLDVSSSMGFVLDDLGQNIPGVFSAANALSPDAHFGLVTYVDNERLDATGDLEGGKVHTQAPTLRAAFANARRTYTQPNRNPGDGPSGPTTQNPICEENALDALMAAATNYPWRANATRVVIVATDDTFIEAPDNYGDRDRDGDTTSTDYPREGNYPAKFGLAETVAELKEQRIRVFSFTALNGVNNQCGTGRRLPRASIPNGWSQPYGGKAPIPLATDGENFDLAQVQSGALKLAETINRVVVDSYCNPPPE